MSGTQNISGTANEPYAIRLILHIIGERADPVAWALSDYLPVYNKTCTGLLMKPIGWASNISGYRGSFLSYPAEPSIFSLDISKSQNAIF